MSKTDGKSMYWLPHTNHGLVVIYVIFIFKGMAKSLCESAGIKSRRKKHLLVVNYVIFLFKGMARRS